MKKVILSITIFFSAFGMIAGNVADTNKVDAKGLKVGAGLVKKGISKLTGKAGEKAVARDASAMARSSKAPKPAAAPKPAGPVKSALTGAAAGAGGAGRQRPSARGDGSAQRRGDSRGADTAALRSLPRPRARAGPAPRAGAGALHRPPDRRRARRDHPRAFAGRQHRVPRRAAARGAPWEGPPPTDARSRGAAHATDARYVLDADGAPERTVFQEISGGNDWLPFGTKTIHARGYVSRFNFRGTDQEKKVYSLLRSTIS